MSVSIQGLTKRFGQEAAVANLTLHVSTGEILVLLGPSGCGKSTTMRCIAGLERAELGSVAIGDRVVFDAADKVDIPPHKRRVGMVFQSYAVWPHMTVGQNVAFPLQMQKQPRREVDRRVAEIVSQLGLQGLEKRGASKLSGGQMQRVALARSLVMQPDIILFDEPLSNLDAKLRELLRFELKELHHELGFTSVYVTHDQQEAFGLADRIAVMRSGRIEQIDSAEGLYERPRSVFVADFLGIANIFAGKASARADGAIEFALDDVPIRIVADADGQPEPDEVTHCAIRPEDLTIQPAQAATSSAASEIRCAVATRQLLGATSRYHLRVAEKLDLYAVDRRRAGADRPGDDVVATVPADRVLLLADPEADDHAR